MEKVKSLLQKEAIAQAHTKASQKGRSSWNDKT